MDFEIWKDIPDYEGIYQASNKGRIRSVDRILPKGGGLQRLKGLVLRPNLTGGWKNNKYMQVTICKSGKTKKEYVHRLVWLTFRGPIPHPLEVNHIDGVKTNCRLGNLEVGTRKDNMDHAFANGLAFPFKKGSESFGSKLVEKDILVIRKRIQNGDVQAEIARDYGVDPQTITCIKQGKTWKHVL